MDWPSIPTDKRIADQGLDGHVYYTAGRISITDENLVNGSGDFDIRAI
jgi:hypothetical protein